MKKIKFSVLMSIYYKEKPANLKLALDSVINQTYKPSEIILVEDGPLTQELDLLIDNYCSKYDFIKIIKLKKNQGLGNALNVGLKHCKYEYVARMDTDDISLPNRFEKQFKFIESNPEYDVIGSNIIEFDDSTNEDISVRKVPEIHEEIVRYSKKRNPVNHVSVIFLKSSVLSVDSYQDCMYFEDYYLWMRMINRGFKFYNVQENLVRVRAGLSFSSRRGNLKYIKNIINFENKVLKLGLIPVHLYFYNVFVRSVVSLMPNKLRYQLYQKKLRNAKMEVK